MNFSADVIRGSFIKFSCCFSFTSAILLRSEEGTNKRSVGFELMFFICILRRPLGDVFLEG